VEGKGEVKVSHDGERRNVVVLTGGSRVSSGSELRRLVLVVRWRVLAVRRRRRKMGWKTRSKDLAGLRR
jgi:hypothetical protein